MNWVDGTKQSCHCLEREVSPVASSLLYY